MYTSRGPADMMAVVVVDGDVVEEKRVTGKRRVNKNLKKVVKRNPFQEQMLMD